MNDTEKQTNNVQKAWSDDSILKFIYRKERQLLEFTLVAQTTKGTQKIQGVYDLPYTERCELYYIARKYWERISITSRHTIEAKACVLANNYLDIMFVLAIADYCVIEKIKPNIICRRLPKLVDLSYQLQDIQASVLILKEKLNSNGE